MFRNAALGLFIMAIMATAGCAETVETAAAENRDAQSGVDFAARLGAIVNDPSAPLAGAVLAVKVGNTVVYKGAAGCAQFSDGSEQSCARALTSETKVRVASISKMITAFALIDLADEGKVNLDTDVSTYLGFTLRNPAFPETPITVRHLLSHTSSIRDPESYYAIAPDTLQNVVATAQGLFAPSTEGEASRAPGDYFAYANINTGIAAAVLENVDGGRFDKITSKRVLKPLKLDAGFNWSGVSKRARRAGATLYRTAENGSWTPQTDSEGLLNDPLPVFLAADGLDRRAFLKGYGPGSNPTLFSPQGGLRASVGDLLVILDYLKSTRAAAAEPVWRYNPATENGATEGRFFQRYGLFVHTLTPEQTPFDEPLIGHAGEAYGLYSGAWYAADGDGEDEVSFAFAVTGTTRAPERADGAGFNAVEMKLASLANDIAVAASSGTVATVATLATGVAAHADDGRHVTDGAPAGVAEPRPYDPTRNAMDDVNAALERAGASGKRVIVVLGANWCHDSRGLAHKFLASDFQTLFEESYEVVYVDVGRRDRNLDIGARFGVMSLVGTPTVLVMTANGEVLNADTVHTWRTAYSKPFDETLAYFREFAE
ncbi:MAG: serine hydrolase [Pseudomonadota bacterium]